MPHGTPAQHMAASEASEVHLAIPDGEYQDLQSVLFPDDERHPFHGMGERGAFCVLTRSTGHNRVTYIIRDVVEPTSKADLRGGREENPEREPTTRSSLFNTLNIPLPGGDATEFGYTFSEDYHERSIKRARELNGGLLRVHTHPFGVRPSLTDESSAERIYNTDSGRLQPGAPFGAAITDDNGEWSARFYEPGGDDPQITYADAVRIVKPEFEKIRTPHGKRRAGGSTANVHSDHQDSTIQLFGKDGQAVLGDLRLGLVGCGGVGSILAEHLARLGVGHLVLVDFDRLEDANFNRAQSSTRMDVRQNRLKIEVAERVAHDAATAPEFDTTIVDGSVLDYDPEFSAVPELLDCDLIMTAVDAARPRKVLDHLATAHCLPVIDGGSRLHADDDGTLQPEAKVEVAVTGPGWPCFKCQRAWRPEDVEYERDNPRFRGERGYVEDGVNPDDEPRSPSVIGINSIVAGLMQRRLQAIVLGIASRMVGTLRLQPRDVATDWSSTLDCSPCEDRPPVGAGDRHRLPTGTDYTMRHERDDIPDPETVAASGVEDLVDDDLIQ